MRYEKKLVILSSVNGSNARGTLGIEKTIHGVVANLTVYNLNNTARGEYVVGIKTASNIYRRSIGLGGRLVSKFELVDMDINAMHIVVFENGALEPILYGTTARTRLWQANMMDGFRKRIEAGLEAAEETSLTPFYDTNFSNREKNIKDYFFDIIPGSSIEMPSLAKEEKQLIREANSILEQISGEKEYDDNLLANENYYEKSEFSKISAVDQSKLKNPIDRTIEKLEDEKTKPWQHARAFVTERSSLKERQLAKSEIKERPASDAAFTVPNASQLSPQRAANSFKPTLLFFEQIKDQLDLVFEKNPPLKILEELMPSTKWARVDYDEKNYYGVGLIGDPVSYIAYAVEGRFSKAPPKELGDEAKWLPKSTSNPEGGGFWLLFQSAVDGKAKN